MKKLLTVLIVAAALLFTGIAFAADNFQQDQEQLDVACRRVKTRSYVRTGRRGKRMKRYHTHKGTLASKLNLTQAQKDQLARIWGDHRKATEKQRAELQNSMMELRKMRHADKVNHRALETQMKKVSNQRIQLQMANVRTSEKAMSVLTPEQQATLRQFRTQKQGRWQSRGNRMRPGHPAAKSHKNCGNCIKTK
jgi:Spy/CpxP family protein refolding chaperone